MSINLLYRRPAYVPSRDQTPSMVSETSSDADESVLSNKAPPRSHGIPKMLSFDRIIAGGTCPPCTLLDFMNYLKYVERAAENLQFFLWFKGYVQRFDALDLNEKVLSPHWTAQNQKAALGEWKRLQSQNRQPSAAATEILKGTSFSKEPEVTVTERGNPFITPLNTSHGRAPSHGTNHTRPSTNGLSSTPWESFTTVKSPDGGCYSTDSSSLFRKESATVAASSAFKNAGLTQPFTIQPFRLEINHILQTYLLDTSPRQLNISSRQRTALLTALSSTTHPSAFSIIALEIEATLRTQLHPNFIRWAICNGNRPRVLFARGLGISLILAGILAELFLTLSKAPRGWRALGAIGLVIGIATLIAAAKGMCVVLHGLHHRHLRPWELFSDAESDDKESGEGRGFDMRESVDSVQSSNSYEDAPWVVRYRERNVVRKVFDREVWIQEPALRAIQDVIFLQSVLCALLLSAVVTAVFVAVPKGGLM